MIRKPGRKVRHRGDMQKHEDRKVNRNATGEVSLFFFLCECARVSSCVNIFVLTNSEMKLRHKYKRQSTKEDDHLLLPSFHRDCFLCKCTFSEQVIPNLKDGVLMVCLWAMLCWDWTNGHLLSPWEMDRRGKWVNGPRLDRDVERSEALFFWRGTIEMTTFKSW